MLNFHPLAHIYNTKFPQYLKNFNKSPIFNHTEADFSRKILNGEHYFRMADAFPALLLTKYGSAFPSGMPVLSQIPLFLRSDFQLFSEDKVKRIRLYESKV